MAAGRSTGGSACTLLIALWGIYVLVWSVWVCEQLYTELMFLRHRYLKDPRIKTCG